MPNKKFTHGLDLQQNVITGLPAPSSSSDAVSKSYVDDKTAEIYTSVTDDFNDSTKIGSSSGIVVDDGQIRPLLTSYTDDFSTQNYMDEDYTSSFIDIANGVAYINGTTSTLDGFASNFTGYDGANNQHNIQNFLSKNYSFSDNVTKFRLMADYTAPSGLTGFTTLYSRKIVNNDINPINLNGVTGGYSYSASNEVTIDGVKQTWVSQFHDANATDLQIVTPNTTILIATTISYVPTISDTLIRNAVIEEDVSYVYFAYPSSASQYTIVRINKSTLAVDGSSVAINGTTMQKIDIKAQDNRLHILWTDSGTRTVNYNFINTNSWGSLAGTTQALVTNTTTTDIMYSCQLVPADGNKMGWVSFTRKSTNCIHFGIIDTTSNTIPYQFKTAPVATATNLVGCMTITNSGNGSGCMVFDSINNLFYIMTARNADNGLSFCIINNGQTTTTTIANSNTTAAPLNSFSKRNMVALLENQSNVHLVWTDSTRTILEYTKVSFASNTLTNLNTTGTILDTNSSGSEYSLSSIHQIGSNPFQFQINCVTGVTTGARYSNFSFKTNIQPILFAKVGSATSVAIKSGVGVEFTLSATNSTNVRFDFIYPINRIGQTTAINLTNQPLSVELNSYTLEQVLPAVTSSSLADMISIPLVTDRIVKSVTLDVTQNVGIVGNNIQWQVASLGDNWVNIGPSNTPPWTVNFDEGQYGSQLRVKATLTKAAGATTIDNVPTIQKYVANVKNVVTVSDIFPMQVNLLKLSLYVNTQVTANRYGYKNQMVDLFSSADGIANSDGMTLSSGTYTNTSGSNKTLTSTQEDTDISTVSSIIVVGDASNGVTYQVRRGDGDTWATVTTETVYTFQNGTPSNKVQIRAIIPDGGSITGWAYLYA